MMGVKREQRLLFPPFLLSWMFGVDGDDPVKVFTHWHVKGRRGGVSGVFGTSSVFCVPHCTVIALSCRNGVTPPILPSFFIAIGTGFGANE